MIKSIAIGVWVCAVTMAAGYFGSQWQPDEDKHSAASETPLGKMSQVKLKPLNIPIMSGDKVTGYVICQIAFLASAEKLKALPVKPDVFIFDAAYRSIYTKSGLDISQLKKESWPVFAKAVKDAVNARYGSEVLHDVLIEEFGFVSADASRRRQESARSLTVGSDTGNTEKKSKSH